MEEQIQTLTDASLAWLNWLGPNAWLQAVIVIVVGLLLAWVAERLIVATIGGLVHEVMGKLDGALASLAELNEPGFFGIPGVPSLLSMLRALGGIANPHAWLTASRR